MRGKTLALHVPLLPLDVLSKNGLSVIRDSSSLSGFIVYNHTGLEVAT